TYVAIDSIPVGAWQSSLGNTSHYLDAGYLPQYPFGYGLSFTRFDYQKLSLTKNVISRNESLEVSAQITNTGDRKGVEVVQFYVQQLVGDIVRPVRELKGFR